MCVKNIIVFPVNILTVWCAGFLGCMTQIPCILTLNDLFYIVAATVAEKRFHNVMGQQVIVELVGPVSCFVEQVSAPVSRPGTILVKRLGSSHNEQILELYFSNSMCGGGEIVQIAIRGKEAYVTFADPLGNQTSSL